ncbi:hypothetical protein [Deinococcus sp. PEB2-63]
MTLLDITHGCIRLQATPGTDGLDTLRVTDTRTGQPVQPREVKLGRVAFLHGVDGWRRVPRHVTLDIEATILAFHGRPTTLHDLMRVNDIVMP